MKITLNELRNLVKQVLKENNELKGAVCSVDELQKIEEVKNRVSLILPKAIQFWKSWLEDPITKKKIKEGNNFDDAKLQETYSKYFNLIQQIKIVYVGRCFSIADGGYYAFVKENSQPIIYYSAEKSIGVNDDFIEETLIHEIQHLLYFIQPMSPQLKLENCFNIKNKPKGILKNFIKNLFKSNSKKNKPINLNIISKNFGISSEEASTLHNKLSQELDFQKAKLGYIADNNENYSRVMELRRKFGITPEQKLTSLNFKPYIKTIISSTDNNLAFDTLNHTSLGIYWFLLHWAYKGFPDFDILLNNLNQLAYQQGGDGPTKTV